jgi:phosphoserine phosphatase RsbU/P
LATCRAILLVEDSPIEAERLCAMIRAHAVEPWEVITVRSAASAERALAEKSFDLVLVDLTLPDSRGVATFNRLHNLSGDAGVVVLTGSNDERTGLDAMRAGAQDYLVKDRADGPTLVRSLRYALERRRAETCERQQRGLQEAIGAMEEVLAIVSHELRTPLATQQLACEYLLTEQATPEERRRYLGIMQSQVQRMFDTITNVLDAARMEKGAVPWKWGVVDAASACSSAMEAVALLVNREKVKLSMKVEPEGLRFSGDAAAVRRLLVNLLVNASKHTDTGEIHVSAMEFIRSGCRWVRLAVSDSGRGIADDAVDKLGIAFALSTSEGPSRRHGSGLGLAICRGIAAAHGGEITFRTEPNRGTTFCAMLRADLAGPASQVQTAVIRREAA